MNTEKKIIELEPREARPCQICEVRNADTRKIKIESHRSGTLAEFWICRACLKKTAIDICAAFFDFMETTPAKTTDPEPKT